MAIGGAVLLGGLAGWLLGAHALQWGISSAFSAPAGHKLPRMIVPGAFAPNPASCDPAVDVALTCYAEPEDTAVLTRDAALPAMAISWP